MTEGSRDEAVCHLIDSHAHLDMKDFDEDRDEVLDRAARAGVVRVLNPGFNLESSRRSVSLARAHDRVFAAVGVHPHDARSHGMEDEPLYHAWTEEPRVVAVGEIGLDYYRDLSPRDVQQAVFRRFIGIAREVRKPIIVHVREAYDDALRILREERASEVGGVMHCFSGGWPEARECLRMGLLISFAGPVTYPNAGRLRESAKMVPLDMLLVETDAPYLSPQQYRGKRNEPGYVVEVAREIARLRGVGLRRVCEAVTSNASRVFGIGSQA